MEMSPTKIGGSDGALTGEYRGVRATSDVGYLLVEASNACNLALLYGGSFNVHASYNNQEEEIVSINNVVIYFYKYIENSKSHPFPLAS
jgi:hypothetical protein